MTADVAALATGFVTELNALFDGVFGLPGAFTSILVGGDDASRIGIAPFDSRRCGIGIFPPVRHPMHNRIEQLQSARSNRSNSNIGGVLLKREPVDSTHLVSVGYDANSSVLEVEFEGGAIYQYDDVAHDVYLDLMNAGSHGEYFDRHVKKAGFTYRRLT